ncbi:hypothetical protein ABBQ32_007186 [Trebouxia sp. C0010 RCD-2024]
MNGKTYTLLPGLLLLLGCLPSGQTDGPGRQLKQSDVDSDVLGQIIQTSCSNAAYDAWSAAASASFEGNSRRPIQFYLAHAIAQCTPSADDT